MSLSHYAAFFLSALLLALTVTPLMRTLAYRIGALDRGTGRRVHEGVVPRLGGGGIYAGFALPMLYLAVRYPQAAWHRELIGILAAATIVFVIGVYDDLRGAPIRNKLFAEIVAALVLYGWGLRIEALSGPFGGHVHLGWLGLPATVLWVVVITNAINLIDGLDGLAAGTGVLIAATLFVVAPGEGLFLRVALCVLIGALLGFLRHNFPPATIFMGDSGSLLLGFLLSAFSLQASFKAAAMVTLLAPLLVFSHPLLDMVYAVLRRYYRGLPLGRADREHIHHKLLDMGFSRRAVLSILVGINACALVVAAIAARRQLRGDIAILVLMPAAGLLGLRLLGYVRSRTELRDEVRVLGMDRHRRYLLYLIRDFRGRVGAMRTEEEFSAQAATLFLESGLAAVELDVEGAGARRRVIRFGSAAGPGLMRVEYPIECAGRVLGTVVLHAPSSRGPLTCAPELGAVFAEAVCALVAAGAPDGAGTPGAAGGDTAR